MATLDLSPKGIRTIADTAKTTADAAAAGGGVGSLLVTVEAEIDDSIAVSILVRDADDLPVMSATPVLVEVYDDALARTGTVNFAKALTSGAEVVAAGTDTSFIATTTVAGLLEFNVIDMNGASGATLNLVIT